MSADPIRPDWEVVPLRAATGYCPDPMSSMRAHRRGGEPVPVLHLDTSINRQQRVDSGKSHLLAHLEHLAVSRDFVCSKVAISKETPLYDLGKVFTSAMENGRIPNRRGRFIEELVEQGMRCALSLGRRAVEWCQKRRLLECAAFISLPRNYPSAALLSHRHQEVQLELIY